MAVDNYTVSVVGFVFHQGKVLLVRKARPDWQKGKLNGVGGAVMIEENVVDAMVRECKEETGCKILRHRWKHNAVIGHEGGEVHFFSVVLDSDVNVSNVKNPDPSEPLEWYDWTYLPGDVLYNLRWLIPLCREVRIDKWPVRVSYSPRPRRHVPEGCVGKRYVVVTKTTVVVGTVESDSGDGVVLTDLFHMGEDERDADGVMTVSDGNIEAFMRWPLNEKQVLLLADHLYKKADAGTSKE